MSWLDQHPEVRNVRLGAADLNGQPRGKRLPVRFARKVEERASRAASAFEERKAREDREDQD